jgi:hypothetical protein
VQQALEDRDHEMLRLVAWLVAELRNLGLMWGDGKSMAWSADQVLGEAPRQRSVAVASGDDVLTAVALAQEQRERLDSVDADGWLESFESAPIVGGEDGGET